MSSEVGAISGAVSNPSSQPLRFWPAIPILITQAVALAITVTAEIDNRTRFLVMMLAPMACTVCFAIWWFALNRAGWRERLIVAAAGAAGLIATVVVGDRSIHVPLWIYGMPLAMLLVTSGSWLGRAWPARRRMRTTAVLVLLGWSWFPLLRLDGFDGSYWPEFSWRWRPTTEERLATATSNAAPSTEATGEQVEPITIAPGDWPSFRGPNRDSRVTGATISADWTAAPPRLVWRIPIGPGWSSFAVAGKRLYTQEQRGDQEAVVCYDADTGREIWRHNDATRFNEIVAGPGPRATPTISDGRLYTYGAKATLNCLNAADGQCLWHRDLMAEIGAALPIWGFASSPLVVDGQVIVYAGGTEGRGLVAYDATTGEPRWHIPGADMNFASASPATLHGQPCVLFATDKALLAIAPSTGAILWNTTPSGWDGPSMVQPQVIDESGIIVPLGDGVGVARVDVSHSAGTWSVTERWSTRQFKPSYNDFVFHSGHLFGFDQNIFACLDAATGKRAWKQGRYGFGQVLLFADQGLLVVLTETGELVLLAADPARHRELGRIQAISGKTWNHPAFAHGRLYVRNGAEAACFDVRAR
jgi:outer membrane protein assembly factor BamB